MIIEKKIYVCDMCRTESEDFGFGTNRDSGRGQLKFNGSRGYKAHDGAWGGTSFSKDLLLCHSCCDKVNKFLATEIKKGAINEN